ncbi:uncharacterized protein [Antedon mediterranea]|uniref:uncharacterized protein n=1 Tax=Antedon mediterranea TaxID=105859 RepID=UPI003AF6BC65
MSDTKIDKTKVIIKTAEEIRGILKESLDTVTKERSDFESQIQLCRTAIELQEKNIIKKIREKSSAMMTDIEEIYNENKKNIDDVIKHINSNLITLNESLNTPEETETLMSHEANINAVKDEVLEPNFYEALHRRITPSFIPSKNLDRVINLEGIGIISNAESVYEVAEEYKYITVTKGQPFEVKVESILVGSEKHQLFVTLINESGEESATEVKPGFREYRITGRCPKEGKWKMIITAEAAHIKGSPVDITVEEYGHVHTIDGIEDLKIYKDGKVGDVVLDKNGCIIVSNCSKELLKFNQSYSFIGRLEVPDDAKIAYMHQMDDGNIIYSDLLNKTVVLCDNKFQNIRTFGRDKIKHPGGLTVNKETKTMYVADRESHCVLKFNVDNGDFLGEIGEEGSEEGQMRLPSDVALTKERNLIVVDHLNNRIQLFDPNGKFMRILVENGAIDGCVRYPQNIAIDCDENILVSSRHKLQQFGNNGVFIKQINNDGLRFPIGINIISKIPKRVAVAEYGSNRVKIYNY